MEPWSRMNIDGSEPRGEHTTRVQEDDPLDAYMRDITCTATPQAASGAGERVAARARTPAAPATQAAVGDSPSSLGAHRASAALAHSPHPSAACVARASARVQAELRSQLAHASVHAPVEAMTHAQERPEWLVRAYGHLMSDSATQELLAAHAGHATYAGLCLAVRARDATRRNRRYTALQDMLTGQSRCAADYFSDAAMESRDPVLYRSYTSMQGATATAHSLEEREDDNEADARTQGVPLHHAMDVESARAHGSSAESVAVEAAAAAVDLRHSARGSLFAFGARVTDLDRLAASEQHTTTGAAREKETGALSSMLLSALQHGGGTDAARAEHEGDAADQHAARLSATDSATQRRRELVRIMAERFLRGQDGEFFDYGAVDSNAALDASREGELDAEDAYFGC